MTILYIVKFWSYCFNHSITQSLSTFQSLNFTPWSLFTKTSFNVSQFKELFLRYIEPQTSMRALLRKLMITAFLLDLKDPLFGFFMIIWRTVMLNISDIVVLISPYMKNEGQSINSPLTLAFTVQNSLSFVTSFHLEPWILLT